MILRACIAILLGYLLGAIPSGYILVWLFKKVDIRSIGSGRTGGTNVLRSAGLLPAALTVAVDFAKGYGAVMVARMLAPQSSLVEALAGLAAVVGHNWPIFLGFHGGAGTMTSIGAAAALFPIGAAVAGVCGALAIALSRYASLGSLTLAAALSLSSLVAVFMGWPASLLLLTLGSTALTVWQLRPNIERLRHGTERKVGQPAQSDARAPRSH